MGEGSGLAIFMRPRGDTIPILADASLLPARFTGLAASYPASDTEAMVLCGSQITMPLSDKSIPTSCHTILIFGKFNRGQKCLDMSVNNSCPISNNLAGGHDRLYGPTAAQVRRHSVFEEDCNALQTLGKLVAIFGGYLGLACK